MKRNLSLLLILILTSSSLMIINTTFAQSIPKPSVPEFTLKYIDLSYDVPPTYGIDEFTGKTVIKQEGYRVDNQSIAFKIKNQPFVSYTDEDGNFTSLFYNFRYKGHYGDEWRNYPFSGSGQSTHRYEWYETISPKFPISNSIYTEAAIPLHELFGVNKPTIGSAVDFQVQALIGHIDPITTGPIAGDGFYRFTGQSSDWSNTQTITIIGKFCIYYTLPNRITNTISNSHCSRVFLVDNFTPVPFSTLYCSST